MNERESAYTRSCEIQVDDAYPSGEFLVRHAGRDAENKVLFVAAISLNPSGQPLYADMASSPGFTRHAIAEGAATALLSGCQVISDSLTRFAGVTDAGCGHDVIIVGTLKPEDPPEFASANTVLGNLESSLGVVCHSLYFATNGPRYLATFVYRFHRHFHLDTIHFGLLVAAATIAPRPESLIRQAEGSC